MPVTHESCVRLSRRVTAMRPSGTLAVAARVRELRAAGHDIIAFGAGEPDFDTPRPIKDAAIMALLAGKTKYAPTPGDPRAREAIARKLRDENGVECSAGHVVITAGAKHAVSLALDCLLDPGRDQEVVIPTPAWLSYMPLVELSGGRPIEVAGAVENDFKITPDQLAAAIGPRTVGFILNSPSNPCGTMYSPAEVQALAEVLADHPQVAIISDEIYEKIVYGSIKHRSIGSIEAVRDRVITINGMSKAFAMTGWRIGYVVAPGNGGAIATAVSTLQSQTTSCITSFCYDAIVAALEGGREDTDRMCRAFGTRARLIHELVSAWPGVRCPRPTGAFYIFPDMSAYLGRTSPQGVALDSSLAFAQALLEEANVAVIPGQEFGRCGATHVRFSFACSEELIRAGCGRIEEWLAGVR